MIQLEARKLAFFLCATMLLLALVFVFSNSGSKTSLAIAMPFLKGQRNAEAAVTNAAYLFNPQQAELDEQVKKLQQELLDLELRIGTMKALHTENARLRAELRLRPFPGWQPVRAEILLRDPAFWDYSFVVDKGSSDGIVPGAIVTVGGAVAGRVREVNRHSARVDTILSPTCQFSVVLDGSDHTGIIRGARGTNGKSDYRCEINFLPLDIDPNPDHLVMTSGLGGTMPGGIPVGTIVPVNGLLKTDIDHARSMAFLLPRANLQKINFVTILVRNP